MWIWSLARAAYVLTAMLPGIYKNQISSITRRLLQEQHKALPSGRGPLGPSPPQFCHCSFAFVAEAFSSNNKEKWSSMPAGGPALMSSFTVSLRPMDRKCDKERTRERAIYTVSHRISFDSIAGKRQWNISPGSAVAPCNVYNVDAF